jgi:hypothetical protein
VSFFFFILVLVMFLSFLSSRPVCYSGLTLFGVACPNFETLVQMRAVFLKTVDNLYGRGDLDIEKAVAGWKWADLKLLVTRVWCVQEIEGHGVRLFQTQLACFNALTASCCMP